MSRTRIAICVDGLGEGWLGGVNYFRNLIKAFDRTDPDRLELFVLTDDPSFLDGEALSDRVRVLQVPMLRQRSPRWYARKVVQALAGRDVLLLSKLESLKIELVAFSFVQGASRQGIRCAPWIPDFQSERHPEFFSPQLVQAERRRSRKYIADAGTLIVSSESAREDAEKYFDVRREQVHVVSFAPSIDADAVGGIERRNDVLRRHGIDRPYFFLPNQFWQHKNHFVVARALALLRERGAVNDDLPLIISTGNTVDHRNPGHFPAFQAFLAEHSLAGNFKVLGIIPRADMLVLMANCVALINPSLFEGWSSTVEEAKALGKRLMVSDIPVHREQVRHYEPAARFEPHDAEALAGLLAAENPGRIGFEAYRCRPNPQLYEDFSRRYIDVLNRLVSGPSHG